MTRWWWIRHGPTHQKTFTGWRDVPADLTDTDKLARLEQSLPEDAVVVSSDLKRAIDTATAITGSRLRLPHAPQIREFDFGDWDGRHFADVAETDPKLSRAFWEGDPDARPPKGESWRDLTARVDAFVSSTNADLAGRDIIAVAHIGVILTQFAKAAELSASQALAQPIEPLSLTRIDHTGAHGKLYFVNQIS